jgi:hemolysin D
MFQCCKRQSDDSHEFRPILAEIEDRPLNPLGRLVFWIILAALLFGVIWMIVGKVDVVVSGRGRFIPDGEVKVLQPLTSGVVRVIGVKEGDYVQQGQVLMEIDPSDVEPELESMKTNLLQLNLEKERLTSLLHEEHFSPDKLIYNPEMIAIHKEIFTTTKDRQTKQLSVKEQELLQVAEQIKSVQESRVQLEYLLDVSQNRLERLEKVRDIISREVFEDAQTACEQYKNDLNMAQYRLQELFAGRNRILKEMEFAQEDYRNTLYLEFAEKERQGTALEARIEQSAFIAARQQIMAPVSGYIAKMFVHTVGGVVTPAEKLLFLVPNDAPMVVKATVMNRDVGFVVEEMETTIKVDAFDFQKYGTLSGKVRQVSRDSIEDSRLGNIYEVYITPENFSFNVEGKETRVSTGMNLTAEINVGKRRIIEFFIYPLIKYLDEGMSVR